jgi:hypothetical protein
MQLDGEGEKKDSMQVPKKISFQEIAGPLQGDLKI